jgi:hypothetical protein
MSENDAIELKTWPEYFADVASGAKPFELRRHDRNVVAGSVLRLREWSPTAEAYTGRDCLRRVTYVLQNAPQFGLEDGFAIYGLAALTPPEPASVVEVAQRYQAAVSAYYPPNNHMSKGYPKHSDPRSIELSAASSALTAALAQPTKPEPFAPLTERGTSRTEAELSRDGFFLNLAWIVRGKTFTRRLYEPQGMSLSPALVDLLVEAAQPTKPQHASVGKLNTSAERAQKTAKTEHIASVEVVEAQARDLLREAQELLPDYPHAQTKALILEATVGLNAALAALQAKPSRGEG